MQIRLITEIATALCDPGRVRVLLALRGGELCMCQVTELLQLAPSTVSKHLSVLARAGLIDSRKQGRWMYFRISDRNSPQSREALDWVLGTLGRDPQIAEDSKNLKKILAEDPEELCKRQCARKNCCSSAPATRAARKWPRASRATSKAT